MITMDAHTSTNTNPDSGTLQWNHTVGSGQGTVLLVGIALRNNKTVSSVTLGSIPLQLVCSYAPGADVRTEIWAVMNPPAGTQQITISVTSTTITAGSVTFFGVKGIRNSITGGSGSGVTSSLLTLPANAGELVVDVLGTQGTTSSLSVSGGQTSIENRTGTANRMGMSYRAGVDPANMVWNFTSDFWSGCAVVLLPATNNPSNTARYVKVGDGVSRCEGAT